jgi:osmoprotectant transport system substrate-binding protein
MRSPRRLALIQPTAAAVCALAIGLGACGAGTKASSSIGTSSTHTSVRPGAGKPPVVIGDKNFSEQFVLGWLYRKALEAQGFDVSLDENIGPSEVTMQALTSGRLDMYPEYLETWNRSIAGYQRVFRTRSAAYRAGQSYAQAHGLELLAPTPFSDTSAIAVASRYAAENALKTIGDLRNVAATLTIGGPPQFSQSQNGLPAIEREYAFVPAAFRALEVGDQYRALDAGLVQAADVNSTDGQLISDSYTVLRDPRNAFGWGNVVPVVPLKVVDAEGPAFAATINRVSALLTAEVMRRLNAAVDISHEDPSKVAKQFLSDHGLISGAAG